AAEKFAAKKYPGGKIGVVGVRLSTERFIDLQHPNIHRSLEFAEKVIQRRLAELGLKLEVNWRWVRPQACLYISVYLLALEELFGSPFDLLRTQFNAPRGTTVEGIRNPELCARRPTAFLGHPFVIQSPEDIVFDPSQFLYDWRPSTLLARAAEVVG